MSLFFFEVGINFIIIFRVLSFSLLSKTNHSLSLLYPSHLIYSKFMFFLSHYFSSLKIKVVKFPYFMCFEITISLVWLLQPIITQQRVKRHSCVKSQSEHFVIVTRRSPHERGEEMLKFYYFSKYMWKLSEKKIIQKKQ